MRFAKIKKRIFKLILILSISISMINGPAASNEVSKMLECISGIRDEEIKEMNDEIIKNGKLIKKGKRNNNI